MEMSLLSCPVCLKPHFQGVDALRSSLINVATTHISCPVCSELLLGLDKLTIHLFSHISSNKVSQDCSVQKSTSEQVEAEKKISVAENNLNLNIFNTLQDTEILSKNNVNVPVAEEKPEKNCVTCDICNFHFSDETILDLHQKLLHQTTPDTKTGKYNYHCHLCSKQFKMRGSLMVHLRVAHFGFIQSNNRNSLICNNESDNISPTNERLKLSSESVQCVADKDKPVLEETQVFLFPSQHTQTEKRKVGNIIVKAQDKQWECEVCLKLFTTKYFLKKHKRLHTGEMPYYCSQCNKYFTFQQSYHKHMLYHSDDKPHVCSECGRAFKELSTLHNHERIHSGERPFSCETCGKCFRQRVSYLVHRRIHTGAMPYKCTACNKSFRYKVSQRSHKCPMNPPGCVVRTPDLVEKLIQNQKINNITKISDQREQNGETVTIKFDIHNCDANFSSQNVTANINDISSMDTSTENFDFSFVEQNMPLDASKHKNINMIRNYLEESTCFNQTQCSSDNDSMDASTHNHDDVRKENSQKLSLCHIGNQTAKDDVAVSFPTSDNSNPDFFALILSPVLSDVQSLCLSNYTAQNNNKKKQEEANCRSGDVLQTINEESFKELLYGPK